MSLFKKKILGIGVTMNSKKEILEFIQKYLSKKLVIVTPNPEQVILARDNPEFKKILNRADIALPDGVGLAMAIGVKRIAGVEFMEDLVGAAAKEGYTMALIGGRGGVAVEALECLRVRFPGLKGWASEPEEKSIEDIAKKLVATKTRMAFIGLGAPKQEYFIEAISNQLSAISKVESRKLKAEGLVLMSVGGSFDIIAGRTPRAPSFVRAIGLEWLWRLVRQPRRWKRQLALVRFLLLVLSEKLHV